MRTPDISRAVVATGYGSPDVLDLIPIDRPRPAAGQVGIEVRAAGLNPFDAKLYSGAMGSDPASLPLRLGSEVAGVVTELGEGVTEGGTGRPLAVGDEVIAYPVSGGYATDVVTAADNVFPKPSGIDMAQASGLMLTGVTAAHLLAAVGAKAGETVLLHGAGGGVGQMVIQLAAARGVRVIGTASPNRHDELRALAPDAVVPVAYGDGLLDRVRAAAPDGVDAAVDAIGTDEAVDTSLALVDTERFASIAAFGRAGDGIRLLGGGPGADPGTELRRAARAELIALVEDGRLTVTVDRTYPLAEARAAHTYLRSGHARGKIALIP